MANSSPVSCSTNSANSPVSLSHVVVDLLVAYGVFLAEGKGG